MIVRVLRARLAPGRSADFHAYVVDVALPPLLAQDGLIDVHVGLRTEGSQEVGLIVSIWRDWSTLEAALGPDPSIPHLLTDVPGLVLDATVEHFEGMATPLPERQLAGELAIVSVPREVPA